MFLSCLVSASFSLPRDNEHYFNLLSHFTSLDLQGGPRVSHSLDALLRRPLPARTCLPVPVSVTTCQPHSCARELAGATAQAPPLARLVGGRRRLLGAAMGRRAPVGLPRMQMWTCAEAGRHVA